MSILLVRHGETPSNAARIVQLPDAPLSPRGVDQAQRLATRLVNLGVATILSSDLVRAKMTAERAAAATGAPVELWPELRERDFGAIRGRAYADLGFDLFAPDYVPPGGESWDDFRTRVHRVWERVCARAAQLPGNLLVVTHGLVCQVVGELLGGGTVVTPANAALTVVSGRSPHVVELLGCTAHLLPATGARGVV